MSPISLHTISDIRLDFIAPPLACCVTDRRHTSLFEGMDPEIVNASLSGQALAAEGGEQAPLPEVAVRRFTSKQMGDACEMLVAAELTLAGIPALKVPDNWPHYDVIAQPVGQPAQRISVKSRTFKRGAAFVNYNEFDQFDWLAIVLLDPAEQESRSIYVIPRWETDRLARQDKPTSKTAALRYFRIDEIDRLFAAFRSNFGLLRNWNDG